MEFVSVNSREKAHLARAIKIATTSTCRQQHGVVLAKGAKVIAVAVNTERNDPNNCSNPKLEASFHAEINAIKQWTGDMKDVTLYSARVNKLGFPMHAKPCDNCQSIIDILGIRKVYHT